MAALVIIIGPSSLYGQNDGTSNNDIPPDPPIVKISPPSSPDLEILKYLPTGYHQSTLQIDSTCGFLELPTPGSHVDLFITYFDKDDGIKKTRLAVEDAVLLRFIPGSKNDDSNGLNKTALPGVVSLGVPVNVSRKLASGGFPGLCLALRGVCKVKKQDDDTFIFEETPIGKQEDKKKGVAANHPDNAGKGSVTIRTETGQKMFKLDRENQWRESNGASDHK